MALLARAYSAPAMQQLYYSVTLCGLSKALSFMQCVVEHIMSRKEHPPQWWRLEDFVEHLHLSFEGISESIPVENMVEKISYLLILMQGLKTLTISLERWSSYVLDDIIGRAVGTCLPSSVTRLTLRVHHFLECYCFDCFSDIANPSGNEPLHK